MPLLLDGLVALGPHLRRLKLLERMADSEADLERFWGQVRVLNSETCWPWTGLKNKRGYGRFFFKNTDFVTHRISYFLSFGSLPPLLVCHKCDNPRCVNPEHLFLATSPENTYDRNKKQRDARGEGHGMHKLSEAQVQEIRRLRFKQKMSTPKIAKLFQVTTTNIFWIVNGQSWKHLPWKI